jgi:hypothetical protein
MEKFQDDPIEDREFEQAHGIDPKALAPPLKDDELHGGLHRVHRPSEEDLEDAA